MKDIEPYTICAFDVLNRLNSKEDGTTTIQILEKRKRFLKPTVYKCISFQTGEVFSCTGELLTPLPNQDINANVLIRYPADIPVINDRDLELIDKLLLATNPTNPVFKDLEKLHIKLHFYSKVRDV